MNKLGEYNRRFWHFLATPFRAIVNLTARQVRSLVTVGFLCGMISLSFENWMITFYLDGIILDEAIGGADLQAFVGFLSDRMRNTSILQGLITITLGAVVLNADRVRLKAGAVEASIGGSDGKSSDVSAG